MPADVPGAGADRLILDRYRVEATLGSGGFGTVVHAWDTRIKRPVAVKTLSTGLSVRYPGEFVGLRERFAREAEAGARMGLHPNIVGVYDLVTDDAGTLYLILGISPRRNARAANQARAIACRRGAPLDGGRSPRPAGGARGGHHPPGCQTRKPVPEYEWAPEGR